MKVCVVGSGGREHALASVLGRTADVVVTPGNAGIPGSTPAPPEEIDADLYVIGPEGPLVDGLADRLRARGAAGLRPRRRRRPPGGLEGVDEAGPGRRRRAHRPVRGVHATLEPAVDFLRTLSPPYVVKTDGLAAGKGVLVTDSLDAAEADVAAKLSGSAFGDAGRTVVIEEGLTGPGAVAALRLRRQAGGAARPRPGLQAAGRRRRRPQHRRHGRLLAGARWPARTWSRRCWSRRSSPPWRRCGPRASTTAASSTPASCSRPTGPKVLEYNVRFGDPEAQVVLPRYAGDLAQLLAEAAAGDLPHRARRSSTTPPSPSCWPAEGYPAAPRTGDVIHGLDVAAAMPGVSRLLRRRGRGRRRRLVTAGGRVLAVTAVAPTLADARAPRLRRGGPDRLAGNPVPDRHRPEASHDEGAAR